MREEREANDGDPEGTEATIYDPASQDWLAGVGGTCVSIHFILTAMKNKQLSCLQLNRKDQNKAS